MDEYELTTDKFAEVCTKFGGRVDIDSERRAICIIDTRYGKTTITFNNRKDYADNYYLEVSHTLNPHFSHTVHGYFKHCGINRINEEKAVFVCRGLDLGKSDDGQSKTFDEGYLELQITKDDVQYISTASATGMISR